MNKSTIWIVVVLLVVVVLAGVYFTRGSDDSMMSDEGNTIDSDRGNVVEQDEHADNMYYDEMDDGIEAMQLGLSDDPDVTFVLTGENFKFVENGEDNPDLVVNEGDIVKIEFTSTSGFHDWVVDEFDAATSQVREDDGMTSVTFVADRKGMFEYYCSVGQHRANGMKGNLIVQ